MQILRFNVRVSEILIGLNYKQKQSKIVSFNINQNFIKYIYDFL